MFIRLILTNSISLIAGTNPGIATVYNVNGLGQDDEPLDDQMINKYRSYYTSSRKTSNWGGSNRNVVRLVS